MDTDPLADTTPARYKIESDDEDELNPLPEGLRKSSGSDNLANLSIKIVGEIPPSDALIFASGKPGVVWSRGATLGEQVAAVSVNGSQAGLVFSVNWGKIITIIVSEVLIRLPMWVMNQYSNQILDAVKPEKTFLLDLYPNPTYITSDPVPPHQAPIRHLSTDTLTNIPAFSPPFAPPNLIQGTSAILLSRLSFNNSSGFLALLPSSSIPTPAPNILPTTGNLDLLDDFTSPWSGDDFNKVQELIRYYLGGDYSEVPIWSASEKLVKFVGSSTTGEGSSRRRELGDAALYI